MIFRKLFDPRISFILFILISVAYLIIIDKEGAFQTKFLRFGPSPDSHFFNIRINTWPKTILVYIIAFFSSFASSYYINVTQSYITGVLLNPAYKDVINMSKAWGNILVIFGPMIYWILNALQLFVTLTMELQYMLPQFIGHILILIPSNLITIEHKKFKY